ncbi:cytochrome b/b6 domain-containing protein [Marinobacterium maritimum]|uniref:Cytochrome b/b6 domain-containing protein n=1 Tax=Marinobacterium maritimum TaxID=500162 RepID=A0ABN1I3E0_9GAMM
MVTVKVWDPFVRLFHWALVVCFTVAWLSADEWQDLHELAGYTVAALVVFRVIWGLFGTRYARFSQFVRSPEKVISYLKAIGNGQEVRHIGHNPAGGMMVLMLLGSLALLTLSGWLGTDLFWGEDWIEEVHELMGNLLLLLVALHLGGVVLASLRHRESLVKSMVTGRKRAPSGSDQD